MSIEYTFSNGGYALLSVTEGLMLSYTALLSCDTGAAGWSCAHTSEGRPSVSPTVSAAEEFLPVF